MRTNVFHDYPQLLLSLWTLDWESSFCVSEAGGTTGRRLGGTRLDDGQQQRLYKPIVLSDIAESHITHASHVFQFRIEKDPGASQILECVLIATPHHQAGCSALLPRT